MKTIETKPQGYQTPIFNDEQQRKEWEQWARRIATVIYKQIIASPAAIYESWGFEHPAAIVWEGRAGLIFRVNGLQHRGNVVVTLDEGRDLYDIVTLQEIDGETVTTKQQKGVFCEDLTQAIDTMVERPQFMTDEEYTAALHALNDPLMDFIIHKAEKGQEVHVVQF